MRVVLFLCASFFSLTGIAKESEFTPINTGDLVSIFGLKEEFNEPLLSLEEGTYSSSDGSFSGLTISQWGDDHYVEAYVYYGQFAFKVIYTVTQSSSNLYSGSGTLTVQYKDGTTCPYETSIAIKPSAAGLYIKSSLPSAIPSEITSQNCGRVTNEVHIDKNPYTKRQ
ncbi:MAG: hypothetical protein NTV34_12500 [Proteobacteria bacterium]|nr:hypothetical protein [Pseudomonadota bacterium]